MKLRTIIVDDEALARERLRRFLTGEPHVELIAECPDGPTALETIGRTGADLLLLDIQMPGMDGFELLRALDPERLPDVVFVTAFDAHAIRAFEARALDYLLKPTSRERLREALRRAVERMTAKNGGAAAERLLGLLADRDPAPARLRRVAVRNGEKVRFVATNDIDWIEAAGNYAILHTGKETHILRETMSSLESQMAGDAFLRLSRSAIVNLKRVKEIQSAVAGDHIAILADGQRIPMTRTLKEVEERMRTV